MYIQILTESKENKIEVFLLKTRMGKTFILFPIATQNSHFEEIDQHDLCYRDIPTFQ